MDKTRKVMPPGPELDALVARAMGLANIYMDYSTNIEPAMEAWAWLEENNPWGHRLILGRDFIEDKSSVGWASDDIVFFATGETYAHAIALAVVEAGKESGRVDAPAEV